MIDNEISKLSEQEFDRQNRVVNLIASENAVSDEVRGMMASLLMNKYSEGYPGRRYYGGNEITDKIENIAKERALKLFELNPKKWHVNVQPLSGSPANLAAYLAAVPLGGKIMGMKLNSGGHLTHGHKASMTGKAWEIIPYEVDIDTEVIDYKKVMEIAVENKPALIVCGFTAYPRKVDFKKFRKIADSVGALLMVDMSHVAGLVAGRVYDSPFKYADIVTTTTHKTLRGPRGAMIFAKKDPRELDKKIDSAVFPGIQGGPHMNQIAAMAIALREASTYKFRQYAEQVVRNAKTLAAELMKLGWHVITDGTDSHLILVDVFSKTNESGKVASEKLEKEGIIVNMNTIPGDTRSPFDPSGIRLGTACVTTYGYKVEDMKQLAYNINHILTK